MTERETQILNHPRAKNRPRLAAYLANETILPTVTAIAALAGSTRDLEDADHGSAGDAGSSFDESSAHEVFERRRAQAGHGGQQ